VVFRRAAAAACEVTRRPRRLGGGSPPRRRSPATAGAPAAGLPGRHRARPRSTARRRRGPASPPLGRRTTRARGAARRLGSRPRSWRRPSRECTGQQEQHRADHARTVAASGAVDEHRSAGLCDRAEDARDLVRVEPQVGGPGCGVVEPRSALGHELLVVRVLGRCGHDRDGGRHRGVEDRVLVGAAALPLVAQVDDGGQPGGACVVPALVRQPLRCGRAVHPTRSGRAAREERQPAQVGEVAGTVPGRLRTGHSAPATMPPARRPTPRPSRPSRARTRRRRRRRA
jgi:hypothetical protein